MCVGKTSSRISDEKKRKEIEEWKKTKKKELEECIDEWIKELCDLFQEKLKELQKIIAIIRIMIMYEKEGNEDLSHRLKKDILDKLIKLQKIVGQKLNDILEKETHKKSGMRIDLKDILEKCFKCRCELEDCVREVVKSICKEAANASKLDAKELRLKSLQILLALLEGALRVRDPATNIEDEIKRAEDFIEENNATKSTNLNRNEVSGNETLQCTEEDFDFAGSSWNGGGEAQGKEINGTLGKFAIFKFIKKVSSSVREKI